MFGFIIPTHITSPQILKHVRENIDSIKLLYPSQKIVMINDHSPLKNWENIFNDILIVNAPENLRGSGEMLPYWYFYNNKLFDYAIILNDGCRANKVLSKVEYNLKFLWFFNYQFGWNSSPCPPRSEEKHIKTHEDEILHVIGGISDKYISDIIRREYFQKHKWVCCYASMSIISHEYLCQLQQALKFVDLIHLIKTRRDRMCLETLIGVYHSCMGNTDWGAINGFMGHCVQDIGDPDGIAQIIHGEYFTKTSWGR